MQDEFGITVARLGQELLCSCAKGAADTGEDGDDGWALERQEPDSAALYLHLKLQKGHRAALAL